MTIYRSERSSGVAPERSPAPLKSQHYIPMQSCKAATLQGCNPATQHVVKFPVTSYELPVKMGSKNTMQNSHSGSQNFHTSDRHITIRFPSRDRSLNLPPHRHDGLFHNRFCIRLRRAGDLCGFERGGIRLATLQRFFFARLRRCKVATLQYNTW